MVLFRQSLDFLLFVSKLIVMLLVDAFIQFPHQQKQRKDADYQQPIHFAKCFQ